MTLSDTFLREAAVALILVTLTICLQSAGMAPFVLWVREYFARHQSRMGPVGSAWLMVRITTLMLILQLLEITLWAGFYRWKCFPSLDAALYFSSTSFSTVGYGDVLLPSTWRLLGPIESVTGVLMCGLSASGLFAIVLRLVQHEERFLPPVPPVSNAGDPEAFTAA